MFDFLETTDVIQDAAQYDIVDVIGEIIATMNQD